MFPHVIRSSRWVCPLLGWAQFQVWHICAFLWTRSRLDFSVQSIVWNSEGGGLVLCKEFQDTFDARLCHMTVRNIRLLRPEQPYDHLERTNLFPRILYRVYFSSVVMLLCICNLADEPERMGVTIC